ncbi:MAG: GNAT family N-acetyltransferase [Spirosomataceae bacterium]
MPLCIRQASEADLPAILNLYAEALEDKQVISLEQAQYLLARINSYPNYKLYVADLDQVTVGTFALLIMDNLGHLGTPSAVVEDVAVLPGVQGQGIGKQMMQFALERCQEAGCYKMALSSNLRRHRAHAFYESLGFKKHGYSFLIELPTK